MEQTSIALVLCCALASLALTLGCHVAVRLARRRQATQAAAPAISILKPLKGVYPGLFENLASLAAQDYPEFEILFGCEDPNDPALRVAAQIARDYPHVPIRIVRSAANVGYNPKVNNLRSIDRKARHDVLLVSDADVRVAPDYLRRIAAELETPETGLVCSAFAGVGEESTGAALENLHLAGFVTATICASALTLGKPVVVGKSMLFRRRDLMAIGGWDAIADVLAEDFVFGDRIQRIGKRVALSSYAVPVMNRNRSVRDFWARHVRWGQMRRNIIPRLYWLEPLLLPSPWLITLLIMDASHRGAGVLSVIALAGLLIYMVSSGLLVRHLRGTVMHPALLPLAVVKDFVALAAWFVAALRTTVDWRGNVFRIGPHSVLSPIEASDAMPVTAAQ